MTKRVVLIHTIPLSINLFNKLKPAYLPEVEFLHILNEVLLTQVRIKGRVTMKECEWLETQVSNAEEIEASAVLVTCTILSKCVDKLIPKFKIPIMKIDDEMVKSAVSHGSRIGVIVTNPDTIDQSSQLILDYASSIGKEIKLISSVAKQAFEAIRNGENNLHDQLVIEKIYELAPYVDTIVLAQASMSRVLDSLPESERPVPILSSPDLALRKLKQIIHT